MSKHTTNTEGNGYEYHQVWFKRVLCWTPNAWSSKDKPRPHYCCATGVKLL